MSNDSLASELLQQLQGAPLQQIAGQLGLDSSQVQGAVGTALPLLMGALGNHASQPGNAEGLLGALGSVLGGQSSGAGILGQVLGGNQQNAAANLGQATGLNGSQAGQLLETLAPIAMSFLAQRFLGGGQQASATSLSDALGQEQATHAQSGGIVGDLLGSVLGGGAQQQSGGGLFGEALKLGEGFLAGKL